MEQYPWLEALNQMEKIDPWRQLCLERVLELQPEYDAACAGLTQAQRQTVENYIAACEELEHASVFLAYALGREQGRPAEKAVLQEK